MKPTQLLGAVVLAAGAILLMLGMRAANAPLEQVADALTGRFTDRTTIFLVAGGAAAIGGALLLVLGRRA